MGEPASAGVIVALGGLGWKAVAAVSLGAASVCGGVNLKHRIAPAEPVEETEDITRRYARNVRCINNGRYLGKQRIKLDGDSVLMPAVDPSLHLDSVGLANKFVSIDGSQIEITERTPGLQQVQIEFRNWEDAQAWVDLLREAQEEAVDEEDILNEEAAVEAVNNSIEKHQTIISAMTKMIAWMEDQTPETRKAAKAKKALLRPAAKRQSAPLPKSTPAPKITVKSVSDNKENKGVRPISVTPTSSATLSKGLAEKPSNVASRALGSSTPSESSEGRSSYLIRLQERRADVSPSPAPSTAISVVSSPLGMRPRDTRGITSLAATSVDLQKRSLTPPRTSSLVSEKSQSGATTPSRFAPASGTVTPSRWAPASSGTVTPTRSLLSEGLQQRMQEKLGDKAEAAKNVVNGFEKKTVAVTNGKASTPAAEKSYEPPWRRAASPSAPPANSSKDEPAWRKPATPSAPPAVTPPAVTSKAQPEAKPSPWQKMLGSKQGDKGDASAKSASKLVSQTPAAKTQPEAEKPYEPPWRRSEPAAAKEYEPPWRRSEPAKGKSEDKPAAVPSRATSKPETPTTGSTFAKLAERSRSTEVTKSTNSVDVPAKRGLTPPPKDKEAERMSDARKRALTPPRTLKETQATCEFCGNHFMEDSLFCRHCGAKRPGTK